MGRRDKSSAGSICNGSKARARGSKYITKYGAGHLHRTGRLRPGSVILIACYLGLAGLSCSQNMKTVLVESGGSTDFPFELKTELDFPQAVAVKEGHPEQDLFLQRIPSMDPVSGRFTHVLCGMAPSGLEHGPYTVKSSGKASPFSYRESSPGKLEVLENGKMIAAYVYGMQLPEGIPERYRRSSYVHPILDLRGNALTDDFPQDHFHHRGLFWVWPRVFVNGKHYDIWHIHGMQGELEGIHKIFEKWIVKETGPVCAVLGIENRWELEDGTQVMKEAVLLKMYRTGALGRAMDITLSWKAQVPLEIQGQTDKGYGGLNLRFAPREGTVITTGEGIEIKDSDLKELPWADESGRFAGADTYSGAAIFQHPENPDFPAGWCLRHYGFIGVAWPGLKVYRFEKDQRLTLKFRVWIHGGNALEGKVREAYEAYLHPPVVSFQ